MTIFSFLILLLLVGWVLHVIYTIREVIDVLRHDSKAQELAIKERLTSHYEHLRSIEKTLGRIIDSHEAKKPIESKDEPKKRPERRSPKPSKQVKS